MPALRLATASAAFLVFCASSLSGHAQSPPSPPGFLEAPLRLLEFGEVFAHDLLRPSERERAVIELLSDTAEEEDPFDEPIETDRHDFTQSSRTVGRGVFQIESGFLYAFRDTEVERETSYSTPELLLRCGLTDRVEFQLRWNYAWKFIEEEQEEFALDSAEDLRMDFKIETTDQRGWLPESAVELRFTAPTGGSDFTTGRVEGGVDCIYAWELNEYFELAGSSGCASNALGEFSLFDPEPNRGDHFLAFSQSVALGTRMTRRSTGYFEWFGIWTNNRDEDLGLSFLNAGVDYLITPNFVIDFRVGWGLTEQSDDLFAGVGGGVRF